MNILKTSGFIALSLASFYIAYITGTGDILNYINFADPLNEFAFCICSLLMSIFCFVSAFYNNNVPCSKELDNEWYNESI